MFTPADLPPNGSGALLRVDKGAWAFVPGALPPKVVLTASISCKTEEAARELGHLGGVGRTLLNPHLLIRPFSKRSRRRPRARFWSGQARLKIAPPLPARERQS